MMSHPGMNGPGAQPYPSAPTGAGTPPLPWQPPPPRNRSSWIMVTVVAVTALLSAGLGGILGATLSAKTLSSTSQDDTVKTATPAAADTHTQDVALCTRYVIVNASLPKQSSTSMELLAGAAVLENAIGANPAASPEIISALTAVIDNYYKSAADAGKVQTRGLAEPPDYDLDEARVTYERAWSACGLDK